MKQYLDNLGIANFEFVENQEFDLKSTNSIQKVEFLIVEKDDSNPSFTQDNTNKELLEKMLNAIGVNLKNTTLIQEKNAHNYQAERTLFVGDFTNNNDFIIPHTSQILKYPELKRDAWEVLKKLKI